MKGFYSQLKIIVFSLSVSFVMLAQLCAMPTESEMEVEQGESLSVFCLQNNQVIAHRSCAGLERDACLLLAKADDAVEQVSSAGVKCHFVKNETIETIDEVQVIKINPEDLADSDLKIDYSELSEEIKAIVESSLHERLWELENLMGDEPFRGMQLQGDSEVTSGEDQSNGFRLEDFMMLMAAMSGDPQMMQQAALMRALQSGDSSSIMGALLASQLAGQNRGGGNFANFGNSMFHGQPYSGPTYGVKGDFSHVTADQLAPYLGPNLQQHAQAFVDAGHKYRLDPRFLASISKFETGNGTSKAFRQGNNAMGISNSSGPIYGFPTVAHSIFKQAETLAKPNGPYKNAYTIAQIGAIYCPPGASNDPRGTNHTWPSQVMKNYQPMLSNQNIPAGMMMA